jgi:hypothetical protein
MGYRILDMDLVMGLDPNSIWLSLGKELNWSKPRMNIHAWKGMQLQQGNQLTFYNLNSDSGESTIAYTTK